MRLKLRSRLSNSFTRRWRTARPGSVLILVVALLVLLALIGTAYLSSTQAERYTSAQNTINTEADLLITGVVDTVNATVANGLFGNTPSGTTYRATSQEMPLPAGGLATGYNHYTSAATDTFLADRLPTLVTGAAYVQWSSTSWPLFTDSSGFSTFDSPFDTSTTTYSPANRGKIIPIITYKTYAGQLYPGILFYVPGSGPPVTLQLGNGTTYPVPSNGVYLAPGQATGASPPPMNIYRIGTDPIPGTATLVGPPTAAPGGVFYNSSTLALHAPLITLAGSAAGDGIADAGFVKVPVGSIGGITYYAATRVIDNNSAINVSSAWTQGVDTPFLGNSSNNYGFFRTNIGLKELLYSADSIAEMTNLNNYRFGSATLNATPVATATTPTNFSWYSVGDEAENQLIRRPGNPGKDSSGSTFSWLGLNASAALAYKFTLSNSNTPASPIEQLLPNEMAARSTPYSPAQVATSPGWWFDNFAGLNGYSGVNSSAPLRAITTGSNAVSNATPARLGNAANGPPPIWAAGVKYNFGDWVTDAPANLKARSFVCIQQHTSSAVTEPGNGVNAGAVGFWAGVVSTAPLLNGPQPGMPFSRVPVKTSINTATFAELWLGFAQLMTDSVGLDSTTAGPSVAGATAQWQPPMQAVAVTPVTNEQQLGQFRSVVRSDANAVGTRLTSSQMLKLRAAIAAVNTMDLRDSDDDVTSERIVLPDASGAPQYDVEVYGVEKQPYISEVVVQTDGIPADAYIAVELTNPYPTAITLTNWQIGTIDRSVAALTVSPGIPIPTLTIPAASGGTPGIVILEDSLAHRPTDVATTITSNLAAHPTTDNPAVQEVPGMAAAVGSGLKLNEFYLMRPRRADGKQTKSGAASNDVFDETTPGASVIDYVPVDQLDMTGLATTPTAPASGVRYLYRRASDGASGLAWNTIYPGCYDPAAAAPGTSRYFQDITKGAPAIIADNSVNQPCSLGAPKKDLQSAGAIAPAQSTFNTVPIELNNQHMAGPNPVAASNTFPFGAFARNADMLKVTFIGAYRIRSVTALANIVTELNSVSIDSALAYDNTTGTFAVPAAASPSTSNGASTAPTFFNEQIGRFCPIGNPATITIPSTSLDFGSDNKYWHYHWAKKLFDYFTVQAPADDYYPNSDPSQGDSTVTPFAVVPKYPGGKIPQPVDGTNSGGAYPNATVPGTSEDTTGVEGLININTAPVAVIAQLPFTSNTATDAKIAQNIVADRTVNGPFTSIFDLYRITDTAAPGFSFRQVNDGMLTSAAGPAQGIFSPGGIGTTATTPTGTTRFDFQERFLLLNNISNLVTTRSDTFTCYVLLQGWRNVGTGNPTLVVQRRAAFLLDRNVVTPTNSKPFNFNVPTE